MANFWYVAATQPGKEGAAEVNLQRQGFRSWMPRQIRVVRHARRRVEKSVPFFPGYIFVSMDIECQRWRSVNGTFGVRSLVMEGERPLHCPTGLVEGLQALVDERGVFNVGIGPGDTVRVVTGPFAELVGTLVRLDSAGRARVLLRLMRGEVAVTLNTGSLVPVSG